MRRDAPIFSNELSLLSDCTMLMIGWISGCHCSNLAIPTVGYHIKVNIKSWAVLNCTVNMSLSLKDWLVVLMCLHRSVHLLQASLHG